MASETNSAPPPKKATAPKDVYCLGGHVYVDGKATGKPYPTRKAAQAAAFEIAFPGEMRKKTEKWAADAKAAKAKG